MFKKLPIFCNKANDLDSGIRYCVYDRIDVLKDVFESLEPNDIFFDFQYLNTVHTLPPVGIQPYLVTVEANESIIGIVLIQLTYTRLEDNFRKTPFSDNNTLEKPITAAKKLILKSVNFNTVVCGNLMITGLNGFYFNESIPESDAFVLAEKAVNFFTKEFQLHSALVLFKDFNTEQKNMIVPYAEDFTEFQAQPDMKLQLKGDWNSMEDYLTDLKSKYRVRYNKVRSGKKNFQTRQLQVHEIEAYGIQIQELYRQVSDHADFNTFILQDGYFSLLKRQLEEKLLFTGYFLDDEMVGFYTAIINNQRLYAHFLGYKKQLNTAYYLYQNMLYDLVEHGIRLKSSVIDFSRTAIEIKSTVGAKACDLHLFLKHTNCFVNTLVGPITGLLKPDQNYTMRDPFK